MEYFEKDKVVVERYLDTLHQREQLPSKVHAVHERPRNAARVRLRVWAMVPVCSSWTKCHSRSSSCSCAFEYVRHLGIRVRDIEKVEFNSGSHGFDATVPTRYTVKDAADRIQNHDGSTSK